MGGHERERERGEEVDGRHWERESVCGCEAMRERERGKGWEVTKGRERVVKRKDREIYDENGRRE